MLNRPCPFVVAQSARVVTGVIGYQRIEEKDVGRFDVFQSDILYNFFTVTSFILNIVSAACAATATVYLKSVFITSSPSTHS